MGEILTWEEIEQRFDREWVELIDFDWPDQEINPRSGVVRVHAKTRAEFDELILKDPPDLSALVFVGIPDRPDNYILNTFNRITVEQIATDITENA